MRSAKERGELTITLRMKGRPVVLVGEGDVAEEHSSLLKRAGAFIVAEGSKAAFAVVVDDPAAVSRLKVRGCLVYAVGQPELSDFTLASPAPQGKAGQKADGASAKSRLPAPIVEPDLDPDPAPKIPMPEIPVSRHAAKLPKAPKLEQPRTEIKMPQVSFAPAFRAARATGQLTRRLWAQTRAARSPLLRIFMPITQVVAANVQNRIDRARERPISLDLALVKGGLLDHEPEASKADAPQPHASEGSDQVTLPSSATGPARS